MPPRVSGMFFGCTMMMVSVALVMAVIVTNIYAKKDCAQYAPRWVVRTARKAFPEFIIPPEKTRRRKSDRKVHDYSSRDCNGRNQHHTHNNGSFRETDYDSLTVSGCCHCPDKFDNGDSVDLAVIDAEWRLLSKFVDRIFFWVFVGLSCATQGVLLMHMTPQDSQYENAVDQMELAEMAARITEGMTESPDLTSE